MNATGNVVLTGFMGTGKSTVARELGALLGRPVLETDDLVTRLAGCDIPAIFAASGETGFRRLEARAVRLLHGLRNAILVTGGGTPLDPATWRRLRNLGAVVCLQADPKVIAQRTLAESASCQRPLLAGLGADAAWDRIIGLVAAREEAYSRADLFLDSSQASPAQLAGLIRDWLGCNQLDEPSTCPGRMLPAPVGDTALTYPVVVGEGTLSRWPTCAGMAVRDSDGNSPRRALLVTDPLVGGLWAEPVLRAAVEARLDVSVAWVPSGETAKSLAVARRLYQTMLDRGVGRDGLVVALGGGAVGDVAGFVAATYMRGVAYVQLPTTLLAQVDSAVGGKTGIDLGPHKNTVGAFHHPAAVIADPHVLSTLPMRELRSGWAEVLKYGLLRDSELWRVGVEIGTATAQRRRAHGAPPSAGLVWVVARCLKHKAAIVARDPSEQGERELLNLGHTLGHAAEATARGRLRHGEAVAAGLDFAAYAGERLGVSEAGTAAEVRRGLAACGLWPPRTRLKEPTALLAFMQQDKKIRSGRCRLVLLKRPGQACPRPLTVPWPELGTLVEDWLDDQTS